MKKLPAILSDLRFGRTFGPVLLSLLPVLCVAAGERNLSAGDVEIPVHVVEAQQRRALVLWLPSEHGVQEGQRRVAETLAGFGIETWLADPFEAWLLPAGESGLMQLQPKALARAIQRVAEVAGVPVVVASHDRGSVLALEALRLWQIDHPGDARVRGALLITPNLALRTPEPGQPARLTPAIRSTNLPLFLIQPELSTTALRLPEWLDALAEGGARVYWRGVPGARDRFFFRPDASSVEQERAASLADWMAQGVLRLLREPLPARAAEAAAAETASAPPRRSGLVEFEGSPWPPSLALAGLDGSKYDLAALRGKVVLVNFWASWCPPCVHEMPSMQRLWADWHGRGFDVLAVNLGEQASATQAFAHRHGLVFPILLDPARQAAKAWSVYAYPTSYILDRQGRIRLAVAGGIDWGAPEVRARIQSLIEERGL
ncbi:MAG: TlpA family protein disulfide reductase [Pseudomonadota bacterium]